mgnify:FL=1
MSKITADQIRELRDKTGAPVIRVKKVLEEFDGNEEKALELLQKEGFEKASKRGGRATEQGMISSYIHHSQKIGVIVELLCETDFVARNELFVALSKDLGMQIASLKPKNVDELLCQDFIKDSSKKISDLLKEIIAKTGENVKIGRFTRFEIGE